MSLTTESSFHSSTVSSCVETVKWNRHQCNSHSSSLGKVMKIELFALGAVSEVRDKRVGEGLGLVWDWG